MDEKLKEALRENEKLLWTGKTEACELMDKTNKPSFIKKCIIALSVAVALTVGYLLVAEAQHVKVALIVVFFLAAGIAPFNTVSDGMKVRKLSYAVTDQRLMQIGESIKSVEYSAVPACTFKTDDDGHTTLLVGTDAMKEPSHKWRALSVIGTRMDENGTLCESFAMYNIPDADKLKKILKDYVTVL